MIYNVDCLEGMSRLRAHSVDLILCDLPYGTTQNKWDTVISFEKLWSAYLRVGKQSAVFAFTASQPFSSALVMSQPKLFRHEWIWIKNRGGNFANTVREPMKEHESVLIFSRGKWTYNKQMQERTGGGLSAAGKTITRGGFCSSNYGNGNTKRLSAILSELRVPSSWQKFNTEVGLHPTQKPVALFEYLVRTYSNEGERVLDNCMGSGTTAIACLNTGRRYVGYENNAQYFKAAVKRIAAHA
jgi:site-specific DNA-methyltransferase (adenine-specific)